MLVVSCTLFESSHETAGVKRRRSKVVRDTQIESRVDSAESVVGIVTCSVSETIVKIGPPKGESNKEHV